MIKYFFTILCIFPFVLQSQILKGRLISNNYTLLGKYENELDYWVSCQGGWNHILNNKVYNYFSKDQRSGLIDDWIQSDLFEDQCRNLYSSTYEYLVVFDQKAKKFSSKKILYNGKALVNNYKIIEIDTSNSLLLMTADSLLFQYNYIYETISEVLTINQKAKYFDKQDEILIGCLSANGTGLDIYNKNKSKNGWDKIHILDEVTSGISKTKLIFYDVIILSNFAYLHSNLGILRLDIKTLEYEFIYSYTDSKKIRAITTNENEEIYFLDNKGTLLTYNTVSCKLYEDDLKTSQTLQLQLDDVISIKYVGFGKFFVSSKFNGYQFIDIYPLKKCDFNKVIDPNLLEYLSMQTNIKIFKRNNRVYEIDGNSLFELDKSKKTKTLVFQCPAKIYRYCKTKTKEYISTELGLFDMHDFKLIKFEGGGSTVPLYIFSSYDVDYILSTDGYLAKQTKEGNIRILMQVGFVNHLFQDGMVILSTSQSLIVINRNEITELVNESEIFSSFIDKNKIIWYNSAKGLHSFDLNSCSVTKVILGINNDLNRSPIYYFNERVFFSTVGAWYSIKTSCHLAFQDSPKLSISKIKVDNSVVGLVELKKLSYDYELISLNFDLLERKSDSSQYILYRVKELNQNWYKINHQEIIEINKMVPGSFHLDVIGIGSNSKESNIITISIIILPPIYQQTWFLVFCSLGLLSLGFLINSYVNRRKLRFKQLELDKLKALQEQRERLARDLHDEIGSGLSKIKFMSSFLPEKDELQSDIQQISTALIGNMRDMLWSLDTENDNIDDLLSKIRVNTNAQLKLTGIQLIMEKSTITDEIEISGFVRRNLLMILKEAVNNTIKHSDASIIWIDTTIIHQNELKITIKDNGKNVSILKDDADQTGKYGIASMYKRASDIGAILDIKKQGDGWSILICYPLK